MADETRGGGAHEGGETRGQSVESDVQDQATRSETAKAERGEVADPVTEINEESRRSGRDRCEGAAAESFESPIESLKLAIVVKDEKIASLELSLTDRDRRIELLEGEVTRLREIDQKQKTTIRTQSETIRKNPAPWKNQQRWFESIREQLNKAPHQLGYRPAGAISRFTQVPTQSAPGTSVGGLSVDASTVPPTPSTDMPPSLSATVMRNPTGPRSQPSRGFDVTNPALQGPQMAPAASGARLAVLPEGKFRNPLAPLTNQGVDDANTAIEGTLPSSNIGRHRTISPPPGLPHQPLHVPQAPSSMDPTPLLQHAFGESQIDGLNKLRTAFDALFSKTAMWAARFAGGASSIPLSPSLIDLIRKCEITDQQTIELLSQPTKAPLTARILNTFIKDRILLPRFLQSIDRNFNDQVERTHARVQGQVQASVGLRRNVMINIAGLFKSLPQRGGGAIGSSDRFPNWQLRCLISLNRC